MAGIQYPVVFVILKIIPLRIFSINAFLFCISLQNFEKFSVEIDVVSMRVRLKEFLHPPPPLVVNKGILSFNDHYINHV